MIRMIAACDRNRVMGKNGTLPWNIKEDWKHFLDTTSAGTLLMGRRCYEDFIEFAPARQVVVLTRNPEARFTHATRAKDLSRGLEIAQSMGSDVWICGGANIYQESMSIAEELYLTRIDGEFEGDVRFPPWEEHFPFELSRRHSQEGDHRLAFLVLGKRLSE